MSKIIVLGNGYVGQKVYKQLSAKFDQDITSVQGLSYDNPEELNNEFEQILKPKVMTVGPKSSTDQTWLINCVGYTGKPNVDACEEDKEKCWALNVTFPILLANFCIKHNVKVINISSGCIYDNYKCIVNKKYEEEEWPDFGIDSESSSWYSRTKHAAELSLNAYPNVYTLRVRMPICNDFNSGKNYLSKLLKYNDLLEEVNSKTVIKDLIDVVNKIIIIQDIPSGLYNCVNPQALSTKEVTEILDKNGMWNPHWNFIDYKELKKHIKANRSNCILSTEKSRLYNIEMPSERDSLNELLSPNEE